MDPRLRKIIIFSLLVASLIYGYRNFTSKTEHGDSFSPKTDIAAESIPIKHPVKTLDIEKYAALEWGPDPFRRGGTETVIQDSPTVTGWNLGGILYDDNSPAAIINSRIVRIGESIDGARVMHINKNRVTLEKDGAEFSLTLAKEKS
jgi:type II secretory pathway component PulC